MGRKFNKAFPVTILGFRRCECLRKIIFPLAENKHIFVEQRPAAWFLILEITATIKKHKIEDRLVETRADFGYYLIDAPDRRSWKGRCVKLRFRAAFHRQSGLQARVDFFMTGERKSYSDVEGGDGTWSTTGCHLCSADGAQRCEATWQQVSHHDQF